jgi:glycosyltransferase involved in cell wall biosynthesis
VSTRKPVAFYAPLKSPNHPQPSGDRTMARLLMKALDRAGFPPMLASELRTLDKTGDSKRQDNLKQQSLDEASRLIEHYKSLLEADRPCLWFTYHVYYKAPDWIGPRVSKALNIPYVIAEGSRALRRAQGPWALGHAGAEAALDHADAIFVMTENDAPSLEAAKPSYQNLISLPPFMDTEEWPEASHSLPSNEVRLLTVAMMRQGDKLASYRILAEALMQIADIPWSLDIVGSGEAREEIESLFATLDNRLRWHGQIEGKAELARLYAQADLFVWPAVNEAYGMVLLEAQSFGCPVVAGNFGGVSSVVMRGETGLLTAPGDVTAFAKAVRELLEDRNHLQTLGRNARNLIRAERNLDGAARRLHEALSRFNLTSGERSCAS